MTGLISWPGTDRRSATPPSESFHAACPATMLSKKSPGVGLVPVELEISRKASAKRAQALQQLVAQKLFGDSELVCGRDVNLDFVAFLQSQHLHDRGGQTGGEAIAPSCDPQGRLPGYA